jgi:hypothetical protein
MQAKPHLEAGDNIHRVIDKALDNKFNEESVWKVAQTAMRSIHPHGAKRPSMREVVHDLRDAIAMEGENSISIPPTNSTRSNLFHPHASQSSASSTGGRRSLRGIVNNSQTNKQQIYNSQAYSDFSLTPR